MFDHQIGPEMQNNLFVLKFRINHNCEQTIGLVYRTKAITNISTENCRNSSKFGKAMPMKRPSPRKRPRKRILV